MIICLNEIILDSNCRYFTDMSQEDFDLSGSQLGRLPFEFTKLSDDNNLVLAIRKIDSIEYDYNDRSTIGRVSLENINYVNQTAELKIFLKNGCTGKGIAYKACNMIIEHGFQQLNLNRIYAGTLENNIGFQKLADKLGMKREGVRQQAVYKNGKFVDVIEYGLLKEVWYADKSKM